MAFIDHDARELHFKIVYYGVGLCGKTTNLQYVFHRTHPDHRRAMVSIATETERMLSFDLAPQSLAPIDGRTIRLHLYTVPGAVFYDVSHVRLLYGVDGVVFVADSQRARAEANVESLEQLEIDLGTHGLGLREIPLVMQYNKRDLPEVLTVAQLDVLLGSVECPRIEAIAMTGVGVFDTLRAIAEQIVAPRREHAG
jgi:signal recognition particle receptor subunit beta